MSRLYAADPNRRPPRNGDPRPLQRLQRDRPPLRHRAMAASRPLLRRLLTHHPEGDPVTTDQTFRPDPPPRGVHWPELLRVAQALRVNVYRPNVLGDLERVTTAPGEHR